MAIRAGKKKGIIVDLADKLAEVGIASIRFDALGSGESDGTWEEDYRVSNYISAVSEVYDYVISNLPVDPERVGIWGHSMGGMVAAYVVSENPERFKALCGCQLSLGGVSMNNSDDISYWRENGGVHIKTENFGKIWLPADYFLDRENYKTVDALKNVHIPQLYVAGTKDTLASPERVGEIYEVANEPKQFLEFDTDHFYKRDANMLNQISRAIAVFFNKNLQ
jgi:uncharacterized protein